MFNKVKTWVTNNPVLVGTIALAIANLVRDVVGSDVDPALAIETAILFIVGRMQRAKVVPVAQIPLDNPVHPANPDNVNK